MIDQLYKQAIHDVLHDGKEINPRGMQTRELLGYQLRLEDMSRCIITNSVRKLNYAFMVAEWLWIMFGRQDTKFIGAFNKKIMHYSDDGINFYGAYGPRFEYQIGYVYKTLLNDMSSRQAIITTWRPSPIESKDIPCTISLQFLIRDDRLHVIANMRSNDVFFGLPYDTFNFCQLGNLVASMLKVDRGSYILNAGSFHLYKDQESKANQVLLGSEIKIKTDPIDFSGITDYWDTYGDFRDNANDIIDGKLRDIHRIFPEGLQEHISFLNTYKHREHRSHYFWKPVYDNLKDSSKSSLTGHQ